MPVEKERNSDIETLLRRSYRLFESGDFDEAQHLLDEAHASDFEDLEVRSAMRACGFWRQRIAHVGVLSGDGARGDYLRRQWKVFVDRYRPGLEHPFDDGLSRLRTWVLGQALGHYRNQASAGGDPDALLQAARCLKALGRYEECINTLEDALRRSGDTDARVLSELADTYALVGETDPAKVLMREALYIEASAVDPDEIGSPLFRRLIDRVTEYVPTEDPGFLEWIPVYGSLWGVLNVKRELSPVEYGKLKQSIYALKSEIADGDEQGCLKPRLINRYIRLIDHFQTTGANRSATDEALMEIKLLSPTLYRNFFE